MLSSPVTISVANIIRFISDSISFDESSPNERLSRKESILLFLVANVHSQHR